MNRSAGRLLIWSREYSPWALIRLLFSIVG